MKYRYFLRRHLRRAYARKTWVKDPIAMSIEEGSDESLIDCLRCDFLF